MSSSAPLLRVRLIVCKYCLLLGVKPEDRFRAADSPRGERAVNEHALAEHSEQYGAEG